MKKVLKLLLKIIVILLAIIGLIFGIATIVKFIKLNGIYKKANEYLSYDSFYLKTSLSNNGTLQSQTEAYYKNGTSKLLASNGIYSWTDGERAYLVDEENDTVYTLGIETNFALVSYNMFASSIPGYNNNFVDRLLLAGNANTSIKKEKIDNKTYYCIQTKENLATKKVWVEKDSSKIKKATIEFSNGDVFNYEYELEFNSVRVSDVKLPDITGYKLISGETGNVLSEKFKLDTTE